MNAELQTTRGVDGQESMTDLRHFVNSSSHGSQLESNYSIETSVPLYNSTLPDVDSDCTINNSGHIRTVPFPPSPPTPPYRYIGQVPPHPDVKSLRRDRFTSDSLPWKLVFTCFFCVFFFFGLVSWCRRDDSGQNEHAIEEIDVGAERTWNDSIIASFKYIYPYGNWNLKYMERFFFFANKRNKTKKKSKKSLIKSEHLRRSAQVWRQQNCEWNCVIGRLNQKCEPPPVK